MSESMNVSPELLIAAGVQAEAYSQELFDSCNRTDAVVDAALLGWVGQSAAAMSARAATWSAEMTALCTGAYEHGEALRLSGMTFAEIERHNAEAAAQVPRSGDSR